MCQLVLLKSIQLELGTDLVECERSIPGLWRLIHMCKSPLDAAVNRQTDRCEQALSFTWGWTEALNCFQSLCRKSLPTPSSGGVLLAAEDNLRPKLCAEEYFEERCPTPQCRGSQNKVLLLLVITSNFSSKEFKVVYAPPHPTPSILTFCFVK